MEEKRIAVVAVVIDDPSAVSEVNKVLHENNEMIIGRMDIPYRERGIALISVVVHACADEKSWLTGKLGRIREV